jgi:hypothetical protein
MTDPVEARRVVDPVSKDGYELEFEDTFDGDSLDLTRWLPHYLPQWSSREASAARYEVGGGALRLVIEADQPPWCPEFDGQTRVSSLQTGVFAGPVGSPVGQSRFRPGLVVRQAQENARLYTPQYGLFELRAKAIDDPRCMVALWMIGYEDEPDRSAEICICEIFGRNVAADRVRGLLRRPPAGQAGRAVTGLSHAVHARHLRVPRGPAGASVSEAVRGRLLPRLPVHAGEQRVNGIKVGCPPAEDQARTVLD